MTTLGLHRRKPGIRMQLTLLYCLIFTTLLGISGTIYVMDIRSVLLDSLDMNLQLRSLQIAGDITPRGNTITLQDTTGRLSGLIDNGEIPGLIHVHSMDQRFNYRDPVLDTDFDAIVRILGPKEQTVYITPAFAELTIPAYSITQPFHGTPWLGTVTMHDGQSARIYSMALQRNGKMLGLLQVGTPLSSLASTLSKVILELLLVAPIILLFGALGSYWLAARAFSPIERLIYTARTIKGGDLHQRVQVSKTADEIQRLALTFNDMLDSLEQTFARQRRFTADASHELRTPVAAIRSMTDVALAHELSPGDYTTVLRNVNSQAIHLGQLIGDLLTMARADEGYILFEHEPIRLDLLAADTVEAMQWLAAERGIILQARTNTPVVTMGDEARLIQAMMNLLDNALKYTARGGEVVLSVEKNATVAILKVSDTGSGIAPEHIAHIFERFYRVDTARLRTTGGSGLGLSIVEWVVHKHRGTIDVDSQIGCGTTFTVQLPVHT